MHILVVYATNSGSHYLAGTIIANTLRTYLHTVTLQTAATTTPEQIAAADGVVFGSPSWYVDRKEGQPHETMTELFGRLGDTALAQKHIALYGCGDKSYAEFCGAVDVIEAFVTARGGTSCVKPLRIDEFYFHLKRNQSQTERWAKLLAKRLEKKQNVR